MFMIDLLALYGIIKLHVNNFFPTLICLYALPIFMYISFLPNGDVEYLCNYAC
jgi:hypothetical protein